MLLSKPFQPRLLPMAAALIMTLALNACKTSGTSRVKGETTPCAAATNQCSSLPVKSGFTSPDGLTQAPDATCSKLHEGFDDVFTEKNPEDLRVICPFLRIVNRSNQWADDTKQWLKGAQMPLLLPVSLTSVPSKTRVFGCDGGACSLIASTVAHDQLAVNIVPENVVDIGQLALAKGSAHDCGYTYTHSDVAVNPQVRTATLQRFRQLADQDGHLSVADLVTVKKERCKADYQQFSGVEGNSFRNPVNEAKDSLVADPHDQTEAALIYSYLGGADRGYITEADLELLLTAQIPNGRSQYLLDGTMLNYSKGQA